MGVIRLSTLGLVLHFTVQTVAGCSPLHAVDAAADSAGGFTDRVVRGQLSVSGLTTQPGRIDLPYLYYRRGDGPRPTVFFLSGGPGISNLKFVPPKEWLRDFDVVVLEYRGVGESSIVLKSGHFARALKQPLARLSLAAAGVMQEEFRAAFADLKRQNIRFDEFSVSEIAEDIERLRKQLGLDHIYLVAHSFGTRVALLYQTRYREQTAGSVLFAMNTPGGFLWYPADTQSVWSRYRDSLAQKNPELHAQVDRMLSTSASRPDRYGPFRLDDSKAMVVAFFLSFNTATRDHALAAMANAGQGHSGRWFLLSLAYDWVIRFSFNWADFFVKAYTSDCDRATLAQVDRQGEAAVFQSPSAVLFSAIDAFEAAGGRCPTSHFEPDYQRTLAIVGEFDPSTPIERRPAALPADRLMVVPGAGHADVLYADPGSAVRWLTRFFLQPDRQTRPAP